MGDFENLDSARILYLKIKWKIPRILETRILIKNHQIVRILKTT
ncbi:hypothetical protein [Helicobacter sp. 16-1353]|nr:hypothetical protein [Helicobacter sp. 16-1353]